MPRRSPADTPSCQLARTGDRDIRAGSASLVLDDSWRSAAQEPPHPARGQPPLCGLGLRRPSSRSWRRQFDTVAGQTWKRWAISTWLPVAALTGNQNALSQISGIGLGHDDLLHQRLSNAQPIALDSNQLAIRFSTTAGPCVGAVCACASGIHGRVADGAGARLTSARPPQPKAAAPTPDARAAAALPAR